MSRSRKILICIVILGVMVPIYILQQQLFFRVKPIKGPDIIPTVIEFSNRRGESEIDVMMFINGGADGAKNAHLKILFLAENGTSIKFHESDLPAVIGPDQQVLHSMRVTRAAMAGDWKICLYIPSAEGDQITSALIEITRAWSGEGDWDMYRAKIHHEYNGKQFRHLGGDCPRSINEPEKP
jgi:hypothetical protein